MEPIENRLLLSALPLGVAAPVDSRTSVSGPYIVADGIPSNTPAVIANLSAAGASSGTGVSTAQPSHLVITPTFTGNNGIANFSNAANIEAVINQAINDYATRFSTPITVPIIFQEMSSGLGMSQWSYYQLSYSDFLTHLTASAAGGNDSTALSHLPASANNPVNNSTHINLKTATIKALGITSGGPFSAGFANSADGIISINTHITDVGNTGTTGQYSLLTTVEHEMDEILGLGSALVSSGSLLGGDPLPEDLFRYNSSQNRSFTKTGDDAYFSLDGSTQLARFNQSSGGDYGDWWSNNGNGNPGTNPPAKVQDATASPGTHPVLGTELTALDVIGYTPLITSITGSNIYVVKDADNIHADITIDGGLPQQWVISQLPTIAGTAGDDTLTLDFSNGDPLPAAGITYAGAAGMNTLSIVGTSATDTLTAGASTITFANSAFGSIPIIASNIQSLRLAGGSGGNDAVNITGGTYTLDADTASGTPNIAVTVGSGANITFPGLERLAALTINSGLVTFAQTGARNANSITSLTINGTGTLDIGSHDLFTLTPFATIQGYVTSGYHSSNPGIAPGDWNGTGITSAAAKADPATYAVGDATAGDAVAIALDPGQSVISFTTAGDANLDHFTDNSDFAIWRNNFSTGDHWALGDLNFDQFTDNSDFAIWRNHVGMGTDFGMASGAAVVALTDTSTATSSASPFAAGPGASASNALLAMPVADLPPRTMARARHLHRRLHHALVRRDAKIA